MLKLIKRLIERTATRRKQKQQTKDKKREKVEKLHSDARIFIEGKWF